MATTSKKEMILFIKRRDGLGVRNQNKPFFLILKVVLAFDQRKPAPAFNIPRVKILGFRVDKNDCRVIFADNRASPRVKKNLPPPGNLFPVYK